ncbi:MAG: dihydroorotase [Anaerovoracaceae bacterium]
MRILLKNGQIFTEYGFQQKDIIVLDHSIFVKSSQSQNLQFDKVIDFTDKLIIPGFVDVHVHLREPGFFYKESIATGTLAAAKGGYTAVCSMPNLNPVPSTLENLNVQLDIIKKDANTRVFPYGTITREQNGKGVLSDMEALAPFVIGFTDDGKGVQHGELMEEAMVMAKKLGKPIVAHCEDESLLTGGYIHQGEYAKLHNHKGISSESEWKQVERDIALCKKTGVQYHVCHISTKETVDLIRNAKADGVNITCEVGPHYLVFCDEDLKEEGRFKMNPPIRSRLDRDALIKGIQDGTIDMISTDHAPHSAEEKSKGLEKSAFGIVGLETSFQVLYTKLVEKDIISLEKLIDLMAIAPRKVFAIDGGYIKDNQLADLTVINLKSNSTVNSETFVSKGKATPFDGMAVDGEIVFTMVNGKVVWNKYEY